jgi:virulence-associated protein VapD
MPGRNLFYLVRDAAQPYHPIIGIFALGNSVLNLTVRDNEIGWTVEAIKRHMRRKEKNDILDNKVKGTNGFVKTRVTTYIEDEIQHQARVHAYAKNTMQVLISNLRTAISDVYVKDLGYHRNTRYPTKEKITELKVLSADMRDRAIDNKKTIRVSDWEAEAKEPLFYKKRTAELARLLEAQRAFNEVKGLNEVKWLSELLRTEKGCKAVNTALIANRKRKIGSNVMEIIVCGAIPPYNELLGGKLVGMLACSPTVIRDCTKKYEHQVSEIASRMKGKRVVRDSRLVFLGTTSLYAIGSSQYNRIKVPMSDDFTLEYRKMGITEGYGTVYFSKQTTATMMRILELQDGGRRINNIFGEGTSPRFRLISRGLSTIGIRAEAFLQHYSPRIVYSVELAKNTNEFLLGNATDIEYPFDIEDESSIEQATQELIDFWQERWLKMRLKSVDIEKRLSVFKPEKILVSNMR